MRVYYTYVYFIDGIAEYVGKGCDRRMFSHLHPCKHTAWANHLKKSYRVGRDIVIKIFPHASEYDAFHAKYGEVFWIKLYGRRDRGTGTLYNLTDGGKGSRRRTVTSDKKQSHKHGGQKAWEKLSPEQRLERGKQMARGWRDQCDEDKRAVAQKRSEAERTRPPEKETERTRKISTSHKKPCTINFIDIFESREELKCKLGQGKNGSRSPNIHYLDEQEIKLWRANVASSQIFRKNHE